MIYPIEIYLFLSKIHSTFKLSAGYTYRESKIIVGTEVENVVFAPLNMNTWSLFGCDDSLSFPCAGLLDSIQLFMQACFDLSHGSCSRPPLEKNCPPYWKKIMLIHLILPYGYREFNSYPNSVQGMVLSVDLTHLFCDILFCYD